jgi:hypothetical protein
MNTVLIALVGLLVCVVGLNILRGRRGDWRGYVGGKLYPLSPLDKGSEPDEQRNARDYTCSICNKMGHNKRTCPAKRRRGGMTND